MSNVVFKVGIVREVENVNSKEATDGGRIRAELHDDRAQRLTDIPWAFPLIPKMLHVKPKVGEAVLVMTDIAGNNMSQRYYIGPIVSQPQYMTYNKKDEAKSTMGNTRLLPVEKVSDYDLSRGSFPTNDDVAVLGRGSEDVVLKYDENSKKSEVQLRAGIRVEPGPPIRDGVFGNIMFNDVDPAYIQLKFKNGLSKNQNHRVRSLVNIVADNINLISNQDTAVSDSIHDKESLTKDEDTDKIMDNLHQVPLGDKLVELLEIMKGAISNHVHPWAGMKQCGDWAGYINKLDEFDIKSILSDYVRIS